MRLVLATNAKSLWQQLMDEDYKNILQSFAYGDTFLKIFQELEIKGRNIYVDSGAFTAWNKGAVIDLEEYIDFCKFMMKEYPDNEWNIVNLDVIPGERGQVPTKEQIDYSAEKGWDNYEKMLSAGLKPIHIFHQHEDFKWLRKLIKSSDYIGVSPDNSQSVESRIAWLKRVFSVVKLKVKTHGFAATGDQFVKGVPFYSADSASWLSGVMYAKAHKFVGDRFVLHNLNTRAGAIESKMRRRGNTIGMENMYITIREYKKKEEFVTRLWERRGITFDD